MRGVLAGAWKGPHGPSRNLDERVNKLVLQKGKRILLLEVRIHCGVSTGFFLLKSAFYRNVIRHAFIRILTAIAFFGKVSKMVLIFSTQKDRFQQLNLKGMRGFSKCGIYTMLLTSKQVGAGSLHSQADEPP